MLYGEGYTLHEHLAPFGLVYLKKPTGFFAEGPDIGTSGIYNNLSIDDDLGNVNSSIETGCNTHRQTDWVKDKPGQEAYFDKNVTSKDDPDLKGRIYVGKTFRELRENNFLYYGDEKGDLYQDPRPIFGLKEDTREAAGGGGWLTAADHTNNGIRGFGAGMSYLGGNFRINNNSGFSPKFYTKPNAAGKIFSGGFGIKPYNTTNWGKGIGYGSLEVSVVIGGVNVYSAIQKDGGAYGANIQMAVAQSSLGITGVWAGAEIGAAIGVWFGGVGAIPGAAIGGVIGGVVGGWGGSKLGETVVNNFSSY